MSDRTTGEHPPGTPSQRALGAMELAVRRARERSGVVTVSGRIEQDTQPVSVASPVGRPTHATKASHPARTALGRSSGPAG